MRSYIFIYDHYCPLFNHLYFFFLVYTGSSVCLVPLSRQSYITLYTHACLDIYISADVICLLYGPVLIGYLLTYVLLPTCLCLPMHTYLPHVGDQSRSQWKEVPYPDFIETALFTSSNLSQCTLHMVMLYKTRNRVPFNFQCKICVLLFLGRITRIVVFIPRVGFPL